MAIKSLYGYFATSNYTGAATVYFETESGLITDFKKGENNQECDYSYSKDYIVFAGMGDVHIHGREDVSKKHLYKEDYKSASLAAINGGVAHICDMPNNPVPPICDSSYKEKLELTKSSYIPLFIYAGIGPNTSPLSFKVPYKAYMGPSVGDLFFKDNEELKEVLKKYEGRWVSFHCEDPKTLEDCKGEDTHLKRRPVSAEVLATKEALELIELYGLKGKLCHYSSGEGLKLIREAKKKGLSVTCEATPQHLYFSDEEVGEKAYFQMNPPIRPEFDKNALLEAFKNGEIDYLATDHAPHSPEEKEQGVSGLPGLDTYGGFVTWLLLDQNIDPQIIAKSCCENPGKFINEFLPELSKIDQRFNEMGKGFGFLEKGFMANFSILDLKTPYTVNKEDLKTKAQNSPFVGIEFPGKVHQLFVAGKLL